MADIWTELKRRNVVRVAISYGVVSWLIIQVIQTAIDLLDLPDWLDRAAFFALLVGLPFALIFSWIYDRTQDGWKKTSDMDAAGEKSSLSADRLNLVIIGSSILLVLLIFIGPVAFTEKDGSGEVPKPAKTEAPASIAVLPFVDLSPEQDQEYFSDGLSEELMNVLAKVPSLKVAGRTSAFAFKGRNENLVEIGKALRVAHVLEGSVRKSGNRLRITAQLIKADDGFHLWSETYDRELSDIFAIQDEIADEILTSLTSVIGTGNQAPAVERASSLDAYDLVLLAQQKSATYDTAKIEEAVVHLDEAIKLDPTYAKAWFARASVEVLRSDGPGYYGRRPYEEAVVNARAFLAKGFALSPDDAEGRWLEAGILNILGEREKSELLYKRVLRENPNKAPNNYAVLLSFLNREDEAFELYKAGVERDPLQPIVRSNYINKLMAFGQREEAIKEFESWKKYARPQDQLVLANLELQLLIQQGKLADALTLGLKTLEEHPESTSLIGNIADLYVRLGEYGKARDMPTPAALYAMSLDGDLQLARETVEAMIAARPNLLDLKNNYFSMMVGLGAFERALDYAPNLQEDQVRQENCTGQSFPIFDLAIAYRETGNAAEAEFWTNCLTQRVTDQQKQGLNGSDQITNRINLAVLKGNSEQALDLQQQLIDRGFTFPIDMPPFALRLLRGQSDRAEEMIEQVRQRLNTERAALGLPPLAKERKPLGLS